VHVEYRLVDALAVGPGETEGIVPVPEVQLVLAETKDHHGITDRYDRAVGFAWAEFLGFAGGI
jgi:hypothetical protein